MSGDGRDAARIRARLLAMLGHDLRSPLACIAAQASQAADAIDEGDSGASALPALRAIERGARRQLDWLADVQECLRFDVETPELALAPAYLYALWQQAACDGDALAREAGAGFESDSVDDDDDDDDACAPLPALAVLDARRLAHVLRKLLEQAAQQVAGQAPPRRMYLSMRLSRAVSQLDAPRPSAPSLALAFDVGAGGRELADHVDLAGGEIVVPAFDIDGAVAPGLALAAQLVAAMGGVLCSDGDRWRFVLRVPAAEAHEAMLPMPRFGMPEPFGRGHAVLLIEPDEAIVDYVTEVFESADFDVRHGAQALHGWIAGHWTPAFVLCADSAGDDAWQMLRLVRAGREAERDGGRPRVLLHALRPPRHGAPMLDGVDVVQVLYKPAPPELLLAAARRLLE